MKNAAARLFTYIVGFPAAASKAEFSCWQKRTAFQEFKESGSITRNGARLRLMVRNVCAVGAPPNKPLHVPFWASDLSSVRLTSGNLCSALMIEHREHRPDGRGLSTNISSPGFCFHILTPYGPSTITVNEWNRKNSDTHKDLKSNSVWTVKRKQFAT